MIENARLSSCIFLLSIFAGKQILYVVLKDYESSINFSAERIYSFGYIKYLYTIEKGGEFCLKIKCNIIGSMKYFPKTILV